MGNLSSIIASRDAYKEKYSAVYPDAKKGSIATSAGNAVPIRSWGTGRWLCCIPSKIDRKINIGIVESSYFYEDTAALYPNRRKSKVA